MRRFEWNRIFTIDNSPFTKGKTDVLLTNIQS